MEEYSHFIKIDDAKAKLSIFRVFSDGRKVLYTSVDLPPNGSGNDTIFRDFARQLGENILIDSPSARRFFGL